MSQIIPQQKEIQSQFPDSNNINHREIAATLVCKGEPKASQQRGAFLSLLALGNFIFRPNNLN